jgi:hypothetical protein
MWRPEITVNMFGLTLGSYNKLEEVYKFVFQTKNTMTKLSEGIATSLMKETYIEELKQKVEEAKQFEKSRSEMSHSDLNQIDFQQLYDRQNQMARQMNSGAGNHGL